MHECLWVLDFCDVSWEFQFKLWVHFLDEILIWCVSLCWFFCSLSLSSLLMSAKFTWLLGAADTSRVASRVARSTCWGSLNLTLMLSLTSVDRTKQRRFTDLGYSWVDLTAPLLVAASWDLWWTLKLSWMMGKLQWQYRTRTWWGVPNLRLVDMHLMKDLLSCFWSMIVCAWSLWGSHPEHDHPDIFTVGGQDQRDELVWHTARAQWRWTADHQRVSVLFLMMRPFSARVSHTICRTPVLWPLPK